LSKTELIAPEIKSLTDLFSFNVRFLLIIPIYLSKTYNGVICSSFLLVIIFVLFDFVLFGFFIFV